MTLRNLDSDSTVAISQHWRDLHNPQTDDDGNRIRPFTTMGDRIGGPKIDDLYDECFTVELTDSDCREYGDDHYTGNDDSRTDEL